MEAAEADNRENVEALLQMGAGVGPRDKDGESAFDLTSSAEIEELLANYGGRAAAEEN